MEKKILFILAGCIIAPINVLFATATSERLATYKANNLVPADTQIQEENIIFSLPKLEWRKNTAGDLGKYAPLTMEDWANFDFTGEDCQEAFDYLLAMQRGELADIADFCGITSDGALKIRQNLLDGLSLEDRQSYNGCLDAEGLDFSSVDLRSEDWRGKISNMTGEQWLDAVSAVSETATTSNGKTMSYNAGAMFTIFPDGIDVSGIDFSKENVNMSYAYVGNLNITVDQMKAICAISEGRCVGTIFNEEQQSSWNIASWCRNVCYIAGIAPEDLTTSTAADAFNELYEMNTGSVQYGSRIIENPNAYYGIVRPSGGNF